MEPLKFTQNSVRIVFSQFLCNTQRGVGLTLTPRECGQKRGSGVRVNPNSLGLTLTVTEKKIIINIILKED